jgi:glycosyltransferase involved in cell wall biosynthesis
MAMGEIKISVILNTYENPLALQKVLRALEGQMHQKAEVIVADDGSGQETAEVVRAFSTIISVQHCWQEHHGFRRASILNNAIARSGGDYIVFLDGDSVPAKEFVADHASLAEAGCWVQGRRAFVDETAVCDFQAVGWNLARLFVSGKLKGGLKAVRWPRALIQYDQGQKGILGCNLGIWRRDLQAVNGYDESFTGWGREDADLGNRLYHLGRRRKLVHGRAIIFHLNHPLVPRDRLGDNQALLDQTIAERRVRAKKGLDQYPCDHSERMPMSK